MTALTRLWQFITHRIARAPRPDTHIARRALLRRARYIVAVNAGLILTEKETRHD